MQLFLFVKHFPQHLADFIWRETVKSAYLPMTTLVIHIKKRAMKKIMLTLVGILFATASVSALSYEESRNRAWYLTDKMAYELNLTPEQYDRAYEINLNYFLNVNYPGFGLRAVRLAIQPFCRHILFLSSAYLAFRDLHNDHLRLLRSRIFLFQPSRHI